jgi:hypothetical protein
VFTDRVEIGKILILHLDDKGKQQGLMNDFSLSHSLNSLGKYYRLKSCRVTSLSGFINQFIVAIYHDGEINNNINSGVHFFHLTVRDDRSSSYRRITVTANVKEIRGQHYDGRQNHFSATLFPDAEHPSHSEERQVSIYVDANPWRCEFKLATPVAPATLAKDQPLKDFGDNIFNLKYNFMLKEEKEECLVSLDEGLGLCRVRRSSSDKYDQEKDIFIKTDEKESFNIDYSPSVYDDKTVVLFPKTGLFCLVDFFYERYISVEISTNYSGRMGSIVVNSSKYQFDFQQLVRNLFANLLTNFPKEIVEIIIRFSN